MITPSFGIFKLTGSLFYAASRSNYHLLSAEKISFSLSPLVPEILEAKVGLIFHLNVLCNYF